MPKARICHSEAVFHLSGSLESFLVVTCYGNNSALEQETGGLDGDYLLGNKGACVGCSVFLGLNGGLDTMISRFHSNAKIL